MYVPVVVLMSYTTYSFMIYVTIASALYINALSISSPLSKLILSDTTRRNLPLNSRKGHETLKMARWQSLTKFSQKVYLYMLTLRLYFE